jgi:hypothetical protein
MKLKENLFELNVFNEIKCKNLMGHKARHFFEAGRTYIACKIRY